MPWGMMKVRLGLIGVGVGRWLDNPWLGATVALLSGGIKTYWEACGHMKAGPSAPHKFQTLAEYHVGEMVTTVVTLPFGPTSDNPAVRGRGRVACRHFVYSALPKV